MTAEEENTAGRGSLGLQIVRLKGEHLYRRWPSVGARMVICRVPTVVSRIKMVLGHTIQKPLQIFCCSRDGCPVKLANNFGIVR